MATQRTLLFTAAGVGVVLLSFVITSVVLNWLSSSPPTPSPAPQGASQPALGKAITIVGDASASTPTLQDNTGFQFKGNGLARIEDTSGLNCLTNKCSFSITVEFPGSEPAQPGPNHYEMILAQSYDDEAGWHLIWVQGTLILASYKDQNAKISAGFTPNPGQSYLIETKNTDGGGLSMTINGQTAGSNASSPFADTARPLTVGGREGPDPKYYFTGKVSNLRFYTTPATGK